MPDLRFSLPPVPPPTAAVAAEIADILAAEGPYHVAGRYIRDGALADRARRQEAERRVDAAEREARWVASRRCPWCDRPIYPGQAYEVFGGEPLHARPCLTEFETDVYGAPVRADGDDVGQYQEAA